MTEPSMEEICPDWGDEERMAFLFSAFKQNREVDCSDWDSKLAFWSALILEASRRRGRIGFTLRELGVWFQRKGSSPLGLDTVVQDMTRRGLIQKESSLAASVDAGWLAWGVGLFLIKPLKWTLSSFLGNSTVSPDESFIVIERLKEKAADVLKLCHNFLDKSHPVAAFSTLQQVCQTLCEDEKTFCVCLLQLQKEKKVTVVELDGDKIVKFTHPTSSKVLAVTEVDIGVYHLVNCEKMLSQKAETLSQEAESYKEDARKHLKAGKKNLALKSLKLRKRTDKQLEDIHAKLDMIQTILDRIHSSQTDVKVVEAYQAGLGALRQSMKDVSVEKVENLMDQIEQFCETQDDINRTLAGENFAEIGGVNMSELEDELNALLETTPEKISVLPDVPAGPLPGSASYDLLDAELEEEFSKLSDKGGATEGGKTAMSLEPAQ
ncbi:charged multivesicular body protein 7 isoform X1 [Hemitrygon akajei]|uniref:charged multivesicular body protein 7 isoform X1 n=1 Tax=Hemitrygon akajei TaxID=2704970 RepID=UPI003BF9FDF3